MILLLSGIAHAGIITVYTSRSAWEEAAAPYDEEFFSDGTLNAGVSVLATSADAEITGGLWHDRVVPGGDTTIWTFSTPIMAWGGTWDLAGPGGVGTGIKVTAGTDLAPSEIPDTTSFTFWGITSTTSFSTVLLEAGTQGGSAETYEMDNLVYSSLEITIIPEPSTVALFGLGLLGLLGYRLRRRK